MRLTEFLARAFSVSRRWECIGLCKLNQLTWGIEPLGIVMHSILHLRYHNGKTLQLWLMKCTMQCRSWFLVAILILLIEGILSLSCYIVMISCLSDLNNIVLFAGGLFLISRTFLPRRRKLKHTNNCFFPRPASPIFSEEGDREVEK